MKKQATAPERSPLGAGQGNGTYDGHGTAGGDPGILDIASLRLEGSAENPVTATRVITQIPVTKPSNEVFIRSYPDAEYELRTLTIASKIDREIYVIAPNLRSAEFTSDPAYMCAPRVLVPYITRNGDLMVWPIRLPHDGRIDAWNESAYDLVQLSRGRWVRVVSNVAFGRYDSYEAQRDLGEPKWPDLSFDQIFQLALRTRMIDRLDHPVLQRLRGEV